MTPPLFGQKKPVSDETGLHAALLQRFAEYDVDDPIPRLRFAGREVTGLLIRVLTEERGVRIEDLLGILGSCGGFACIVGVLHDAARMEHAPQPPNLVAARGADGYTYFFGDLPNKALLEDRTALLNLALGTAHALGAPVSLEMVHDAMRHVASTVGGDSFGIPRLPPSHVLRSLPMESVKRCWPMVQDVLDRFEVPVARRAAALGFAIQHALELGKDALDRLLAVQIVIECAVPMAKMEPKRLL